MITEDDLRSVGQMKRMLNSLDDRAIRLRESVTRITSSWSDSPGGHSHTDKFAEYVAKLSDLDTKRLELMLAVEEKLIHIETAVNALPAQQQLIVRLRYFEGKPWAVVARKARYSEPHCYRIRDAALDNLKDDSL